MFVLAVGGARESDASRVDATETTRAMIANDARGRGRGRGAHGATVREER